MIQIHYTGSSQHWVTSVRLRGEDFVKVYDSLLHFDPHGSPAMSDDLVKQICHILLYGSTADSVVPRDDSAG